MVLDWVAAGCLSLIPFIGVWAYRAEMRLEAERYGSAEAWAMERLANRNAHRGDTLDAVPLPQQGPTLSK